jgi:hypothetical protein
MFEQVKAQLKNNGYIPDTIIDVGATYGNFTDKMLDIFPSANYYLFEAKNHPEIQKFLVKNNVKTFNLTLGSDNRNLDDILETKNMKNVFVKINCKDSLISILKGCDNILKITDFILVDLPFDNKYNHLSNIFSGCVNFLLDKGFVVNKNDIHVYEVEETSKRYNLIFINKNFKFTN